MYVLNWLHMLLIHHTKIRSDYMHAYRRQFINIRLLTKVTISHIQFKIKIYYIKLATVRNTLRFKYRFYFLKISKKTVLQ